ncbi:MAG: hypothetical protein CML16_17470 [Pusillimonas sp.]|nr:hypothetical protein [Pusillimonas sp.]|tara:strand:+ start:4399 stop:5790 length:1392 start_codon:yes stop_codon:yes gene_type:complete
MAVKSITFDKFDLGIDLRKGASVSDANRLRDMTNAYVTTGLATQKRPGLVKVAELTPGTKGLFAAFGKLNCFYSEGTINLGTGIFNAIKLTGYAAKLKEVWFADVFNGQIYTSVEYENGVVRHHYTDNVTTLITDGNCPHSKAVIKASTANKIFAANGETVRYCATDKPRDWTTANDAGFLPTGLRFQGARDAKALGIYKNNLVVLTQDGGQTWSVDPDPTRMALTDTVDNVGTNFPKTVTNVSGDLYFLSDFGFRSITTQQWTNNLSDADVGSPIDDLVKPVIRNTPFVPTSFFHYGTGQYLCIVGNIIFVYSLSRSSKIAAWSRYTIPSTVDAFAELNGTLYFRSGDSVYRFAPDAYDDDGQPFKVSLELPYMDLKAPGQLKQIMGVDLVMEGECDFSIGFDVRNADCYTPVVRLRGNTRPGGMIPMSCSGTEFSLRFNCLNKKLFRLDSATLYYEELGAI